MPRSMSKSQIDKLGERLGRPSPAPEDLDRLRSLITEYLPPLQGVVETLRERLNVAVTPRLKTEGTLTDKLRRGINLSAMQDIAGCRIVEEMGLLDQDAMVRKICDAFPGARVVDRRAKPSHGYRAVHVIVKLDGFPVETQVRTALQHLWANLVERLADNWGRDIRYGGDPLDPDTPAQVWGFAEGYNRRQIVDAFKTLSAVITSAEDGALPLQHEEVLRSFLQGAVDAWKRKPPA
jgi:hypothetical protein